MFPSRILVLAFLILCIATGPARAYSDAELIDGFNKTVFGSEYGRSQRGRYYVRKFAGTVRFHISGGSKTRQNQVAAFIRSLNGLINGLDARVVASTKKANFRVHITSRENYEKTVRQEVFRNGRALVQGKCMVRAIFSRSGISRSDAVIVYDEGENLFRRCMTEEILQGLGPLNDHRSLKHSMFNDTSPHTGFRRFDRFLLNMLYDRRIRNGMTSKAANSLLPAVLATARKRIEGR